MICELQIKLQIGKIPLFEHCNRFINEIEHACDLNDRSKLFEAYTTALNHLVAHGKTFESTLNQPRDE